MNKNNWNIFFLIVVVITFIVLIFWSILTGEYDLRERMQFNRNSVISSLLNS
jgi:hypothetical protein